MDDDRFAEGGGDDVELALERREDVAIGDLADGFEPFFFTDQRDSPADDDPARGEQGDHLGQCECKSGAGLLKDGRCVRVAARGRIGDHDGGDLVRVEGRSDQDGPLGGLFRELLPGEFLGGGGDCPARGDVLEFDARRRRGPRRRGRVRCPISVAPKPAPR